MGYSKLVLSVVLILVITSSGYLPIVGRVFAQSEWTGTEQLNFSISTSGITVSGSGSGQFSISVDSSNQISGQGTFQGTYTVSGISGCNTLSIPFTVQETYSGSVAGQTADITDTTTTNLPGSVSITCDFGNGPTTISEPTSDPIPNSFEFSLDLSPGASYTLNFAPYGLQGYWSWTLSSPTTTTPTTTSVDCNPNPVGVNSTTTCTASVSGNSPTGRVTFSTDSSTGSFSQEQCDLSGGSCSVEYLDTQPGTYTITATYSGDSSNDGSSGSTALTVAGSLTQTTITVECLPNPVAVNGTTVCTATVTGNSPAGTVTFTAGNSTGYCTLSAGSCSVTYSNSQAGTYTITAHYDGDSNDEPSSDVFTITVVGSLAPTTTILVCDPSTIAVNASTTCTATVTGNSPAGTVDLTADGTVVGSCILASGSCSVYDLVGTSPGDVTITATYNGDSNNGPSSGTFTVTVLGSLVSTTVTVDCSPNPVAVNATTTCTATVSGNSPTGTVTFSTAGSTGSCALASGSCSVNYSNSHSGTYPSTAYYSGDSNNEPSSTSFTIVIGASLAPTAITVDCSPNPVAVNTTTTCTATVTGNSATGAVTFSASDSTGSCTLSAGSCSVTYSNSQPGTYSLTADYSGDSNNQPSSTTFTVVVGESLAPTTSSLVCDPATFAVNASTTCTATVTGNSPTGYVTFSSSNSTGVFSPSDQCTLVSGSCSVSFSDDPPGTETITVTYSGDSSNLGSSDTFTVKIVIPATNTPTMTTLECDPNTVAINTKTTCYATVEASPPSSSPVLGLVYFSADQGSGSFLPAYYTYNGCPLSSGVCDVVFFPSRAGVITITARYSGIQDQWLGSSQTFQLTVPKSPTSTTVSCTSGSNPITVGSSLHCTATVTGDPPTGDVTFSIGDSTVGSCTLVSGSCPVDISAPNQAGTFTVSATYGGDDNYKGSSGLQALDVTNPQPVPPPNPNPQPNPQQCPTLTLNEGLAPAAPTTGDDYIRIVLTWSGQVPAPVQFASAPGPVGTAFFFGGANTVETPSMSVLMDVRTAGTPDGTYAVAVTATVTDPNPPQGCPAMPAVQRNIGFTVSGTTVFATTNGGRPAVAVWPKALASAILITGESSVQVTDFTPTIDPNSQIETLQFTVTGPHDGQDHTVGITVPKADVPPGFVPSFTINGAPVPNQSYTQDASNFYATFTTQFSTHVIDLQFVQPPSSPLASTAIETLLLIGIPLLLALFVYPRIRARISVGRRSPSTSASSRGSQKTQALFCTRCGSPVNQGARFCNNCGTRLV